MVKLFNKTICLNNKTCVMCLIAILISTALLATVLTPEDQVTLTATDNNIWIPTKDDIAYQDSMYIILRTLNADVKDIKQDITNILFELEKKN